MKLSVGTPAPDFSARDQDGMERKSEDYKGKFLLLYFYPKDNTPGCTKEACSMRDEYDDLKKYVHIIGVSADSGESHRKFIQKYRLPFPLLSDEEKKLIKAYGADGFLFSKRVSFLISPEWKILKIYEKVVPADHSREVLADMKQFSQT